MTNKSGTCFTLTVRVDGRVTGWRAGEDTVLTGFLRYRTCWRFTIDLLVYVYCPTDEFLTAAARWGVEGCEGARLGPVKTLVEERLTGLFAELALVRRSESA